MANSPLDIRVPQMNPTTGIPEGVDMNNLTPGQKAWLEYLQQIAYDNKLIDFPPNFRLTSGQPSVVGSAPTGGPAPSPALPASQLAQQAPGVTGGILTPAQIAAMQAPTAAKASLLSTWLGPSIGAGAGIVGTAMQTSAANNATEAQTEAADKALALNERMYEQDRKDYEPYRNVGQFSLQQLGHLTGMPANFGTDAVTAATTPRTAVPRQPTSTGEPLGPQSILQTVRNQVAQAQQMNNPAFQTLRDLGAARQTSSSFVRMRSPDGEESDVSPEEVGLFERFGAQRIG